METDKCPIVSLHSITQHYSDRAQLRCHMSKIRRTSVPSSHLSTDTQRKEDCIVYYTLINCVTLQGRSSFMFRL